MTVPPKMANLDLPHFDDLEVVSKQRTSVTYVAFEAFDFQDVWAKLVAAGASSCSECAF